MPCLQFYTSQMCLLALFAKKILAKISKFTVSFVISDDGYISKINTVQDWRWQYSRQPVCKVNNQPFQSETQEINADLE